MMQVAIDLMAVVISEALPFAIVFAVAQRIVDMFVSAAFGGRIKV